LLFSNGKSIKNATLYGLFRARLNVFLLFSNGKSIKNATLYGLFRARLNVFLLFSNEKSIKTDVPGFPRPAAVRFAVCSGVPSGGGGGNPKICLAGGENVYFRLSNGDFQREISCLRAQKDPIFACGGLEAMKCTKMGLDRAADEIFGVSGSESSLLWYIMIRWLP
jgi:hypothetical protein